MSRSAIVLAHGVGTRADLPIPVNLAIIGGGTAVLVSFVALAALWPEPRLRGRLAGRPLPAAVQTAVESPVTSIVLRTVAPTRTDELWLRVVDLDRALTARGYSDDVDVVIAVTDDVCPWNAGRFRLTGGRDGAMCSPSTAEVCLSRCTVTPIPSSVDLSISPADGSSCISIRCERRCTMCTSSPRSRASTSKRFARCSGRRGWRLRC